MLAHLLVAGLLAAAPTNARNADQLLAQLDRQLDSMEGHIDKIVLEREEEERSVMAKDDASWTAVSNLATQAGFMKAYQYALEIGKTKLRKPTEFAQINEGSCAQTGEAVGRILTGNGAPELTDIPSPDYVAVETLMNTKADNYVAMAVHPDGAGDHIIALQTNGESVRAFQAYMSDDGNKFTLHKWINGGDELPGVTVNGIAQDIEAARTFWHAGDGTGIPVVEFLGKLKKAMEGDGSAYKELFGVDNGGKGIKDIYALMHGPWTQATATATWATVDKCAGPAALLGSMAGKSEKLCS